MSMPRSPRLRLLGRVASLAIYLVDGEKVRDKIDVDFTMGGNEARYGYVSPGEIWIDDAAHVLDRNATALHELVERDLMLHHGMGYDSAHDAANARERVFRQDLERRRPVRFDARRVAEAYRVYFREKPIRKRSHQIDREIVAALARRHARIGAR
jgi:hypothetical protein